MVHFSSRALWVIIVALIAGGSAVAMFLWLIRGPIETPPPTIPVEVIAEPPVATTTPPLWQTISVIGTSVEGRSIEAYRFGDGSTHLLFVGGIHGGYEWNSVVLAYEFVDHLAQHPEAVPDNLTIHVIPALNPDGVYAVTGKHGRLTAADIPNPRTRVAAARFNANKVDLNRNFACKWQPTSTWRGEVVSAGSAPFSEPEAQALRDYVTSITPAAVVFWHSQANNVYASECEDGILPETLTVMNTYADAAGYGAVESFNAYPVTGDAEGWLASLGIPAVTVELTTFNDSEWNKNWAGSKALFELYGEAR